MMKKIYLLSLLVLLFSKNGFCQQNDSLLLRKIANEVLSSSTAYENLRFLCKKIGPRLSGSENAVKAVQATFSMLKLAGADTVYLQPCMVPHWVRGEKEEGYLELGSNKKYGLKLCALGNSVATAPEGVKGTIIQVNSMKELHALGEAALKGKIVFFNFSMNPEHINTFRAYGQSGTGRRIGPAQAARYGAVGVMIRSLASNPDDYPHTGMTTYNDSFPKIPAVAISTNDADMLNSELKKDRVITAWFKTSCKMLEDQPSFNVIGEIRGTDFPSEIITVGGHLDSWDLGEGAQDDGAGCVQSIEIIRVLKSLKIKPKRTIRAVMFMNEENGGRGAKAYLAAAKANKEKHLFALESDAGGFSPRGFGFEADSATYQRILRWKPLFKEYGVHDFFDGGGGADIGPLKEIGTVLAGLSPDTQRYFDLHHAATDTFETVSRRELQLGAAVMGMLVWLVSEYGL